MAILIILLVFKFISTTVDKYLAPAITYIRYLFTSIFSEYLGLSEPLAAVTLLAMANGAGDVITAIVASGVDGAISYNVGNYCIKFKEVCLEQDYFVALWL